jgi:hypothetical protein
MLNVHIGDRNMNHLEVNIKELEIKGKNKNIVDSYRGNNELKEGYQP